MDEKPVFLTKVPANEIPVPATTLPRAQRGPWLTIRIETLVKLALLAYLLVFTHRYTLDQVEKELEVHEGRWISRVFSDSWAWSPRKVLYGKKAEKVFLCVLLQLVSQQYAEIADASSCARLRRRSAGRYRMRRVQSRPRGSMPPSRTWLARPGTSRLRRTS